MSDERFRFHGDPESVERVIAYLRRRAALMTERTQDDRCPSCGGRDGHEITSRDDDVPLGVRRYVCANLGCPADRGTEWVVADS